MASLRKKRASKCALCDATTGLQVHHIKPRSLGGSDDSDNLITLCERHHDVAHSLDDEYNHAKLVKIGLQKAVERGALVGNRVNLKQAGIKGGATTKAKYAAFAERMRPMIDRLRKAGMTFRAIAEEYNMMGVPTARNGSWDAKTVHTLAHRPA